MQLQQWGRVFCLQLAAVNLHFHHGIASVVHLKTYRVLEPLNGVLKRLAYYSSVTIYYSNLIYRYQCHFACFIIMKRLKILQPNI